jgi:hypothetical protein
MSRIRFGHCIGCDQPIRPPYLSFKVIQAIGDGADLIEWEEIDVCADCAVKLPASELHRLASAEEEEAA